MPRSGGKPRGRKAATTGRSTRAARRAEPAAGQDTAPNGDLRSLARDAALAALKRLSDLSRSEDERIALAATQELLNRAFGKASASSGEESGVTQPLIIKIVKFGETGLPTTKGDKSS
jgi:hypothetical protein